MYRGLPCIYSSAILASASLLSGANMALLRIIAVAMIVFMISQSFYPHDRVLESQAWKKAVYAGGKCQSSEPPQEVGHRKLGLIAMIDPQEPYDYHYCNYSLTITNERSME